MKDIPIKTYLLACVAMGVIGIAVPNVARIVFRPAVVTEQLRVAPKQEAPVVAEEKLINPGCDYWVPGNTYVVFMIMDLKDVDPFGGNTARIYIHEIRGKYVQYSFVYANMEFDAVNDSRNTFRCDIGQFMVLNASVK